MSVYCFQNICMLFSFQSLRKDHQIHLRHLHHLRQIYIYIYIWRNLLTLTTLRRIISMPVLLTTWKLMNLSIKTFTKLSISSSWRFQIHSCRSGNVASKYKYTCCGLMDIWLNLSIFIFTNWAPWWISSSGSPSHRWLYFVISTWNTESCQAHFFCLKTYAVHAYFVRPAAGAVPSSSEATLSNESIRNSLTTYICTLNIQTLNYQKKYAPNRSLILWRSLFFSTFQDREEHHYHKKMYSNPQDLECLKTGGRVR